MIMNVSEQVIVFLTLLVISAMTQDNSKEDDYYYGETCEHEDFYCDYDDPSLFYRCIDGAFHSFHCPDGLHFSVSSQTCDWPHLADCSSGAEHAELSSNNNAELSSNNNAELSSNNNAELSSNNNAELSSINNAEADETHGGEDDHHHGAESSWISQAAASGKSWWRPDGVSPDQWLDASSVKKPPFKPHSPDPPKQESDDAPKKSDDAPKKSDDAPKKSDDAPKKSNDAPKKSDDTPKKSDDTPKKSDDAPKKSDDTPKKSDNAPKKSDDAPKKSDDAPKKSDDTENSSTSDTKKIEPDSTHSVLVERESSSNVKWNEGSCSSSCQLPSCYCAGTAIPNGLSTSSVPQMVMLTFDDEVSAAFYGYYQRLFRPGRYNPNGCPVHGCLYVSGSGTEYDLVYPLYAMGIEIASHTISHRFPHTWWATASYQEYVDEVAGMRENLITKSGIPREAIKGFRVPFLQLGSDSMYSAIYDSKFVYDTSMFTGNEWEGGEPVWPFTLDYVPNDKFCQHGPCPKKQYPGMWEIPVQRWYGLDGHSCAMPDGCSSTGDAEETLEYLKSNFRRYYGSNRAPFGIFVHARWFNSEHNLDGLDRFIDYLLTLDDVYFVTPSQVIEWMKNPTPLSEINGFEPWSCQGGAKDI